MFNPLLLLGLLGGGAILLTRKKPIQSQTDDQLMKTATDAKMTDIEQLTAIKSEFLTRGRTDLASAVQQKIAYLQSPAAAQGSQSAMPDALKQQVATVMSAMGIDANGNIVGTPTASAVAQATALAATLEKAGYPAAAAELRTYAKRAGLAVPSIPTAQQTPVPCVDAETQTKINRALQMERDPAVLQQIVDLLKSSPCANDPAIKALIAQFTALITNMQAAQNTTKVITDVSDVIVPGIPGVPSLVKSGLEQAAADVAAHMLQIQAAANWDAKAARGSLKKDLVMKFQAQAGLPTDGKPGPGFILSLMTKGNVFNLPLVMYWPQSSNANTVLKHRLAITTYADSIQSLNPAGASQLRTSAARERGQGGIVGQMPA